MAPQLLEAACVHRVGIELVHEPHHDRLRGRVSPATGSDPARHSRRLASLGQILRPDRAEGHDHGPPELARHPATLTHHRLDRLDATVAPGVVVSGIHDRGALGGAVEHARPRQRDASLGDRHHGDGRAEGCLSESSGDPGSSSSPGFLTGEAPSARAIPAQRGERSRSPAGERFADRGARNPAAGELPWSAARNTRTRATEDTGREQQAWDSSITSSAL